MNKVVLLIYWTKHLGSVAIDICIIVEEIRKFCMEFVSRNVDTEKKFIASSNSHDIIISEQRLTKNFQLQTE